MVFESTNGRFPWRQPESDRPVEERMAPFGFFRQKEKINVILEVWQKWRVNVA